VPRGAQDKTRRICGGGQVGFHRQRLGVDQGRQQFRPRVDQVRPRGP